MNYEVVNTLCNKKPAFAGFVFRGTLRLVPSTTRFRSENHLSQISGVTRRNRTFDREFRSPCSNIEL